MAETNDAMPSADLLRGLTERRFSRRSALKVAGMGGLLGTLAACSIPGTQSGSGSFAGAMRARDDFWREQHQTGHFTFANWPLYIDVGKQNSDHPSLDLFTKETGIQVSYKEPINEDDSFYGVIEPELASKASTGYDLMVITNGIYLDLLIQQDFLVPLDQNAMSNFYANASDLVKSPSYDRGNVFTMAWQSGITGIAYNPKYVDSITSWQDLQDPKLRGKIGMFGDNEDMPNSALCAVGVNPEVSTPADWHKAADWLTKQRPLVRKYYQQDYVGALQRGDIYATMAWSGDIFQANAGNGGNLKFVVPKEGAPIWTDNMCIPKYSKNPRDAMTYADWVYQPKIAAMLADYINYITPVPAAQQIFEQDAKDATKKSDKEYYQGLATSPLIFPAKSDFARLHRYRVLSADEQKVWNKLFQPIYQS
jgi:spermidine/putrescine transport system substrate-binding protein